MALARALLRTCKHLQRGRCISIYALLLQHIPLSFLKFTYNQHPATTTHPQTDKNTLKHTHAHTHAHWHHIFSFWSWHIFIIMSNPPPRPKSFTSLLLLSLNFLFLHPGTSFTRRANQTAKNNVIVNSARVLASYLLAVLISSRSAVSTKRDLIDRHASDEARPHLVSRLVVTVTELNSGASVLLDSHPIFTTLTQSFGMLFTYIYIIAYDSNEWFSWLLLELSTLSVRRPGLAGLFFMLAVKYVVLCL